MRAVGILLLGLMLASPALGFFWSANKVALPELFARMFRVMQIENYLTVKEQDFDIDINALKAKPKKGSQRLLDSVDKAGDAHGFATRSLRRKPGRKPSSRTKQVHTWVSPAVARGIATEAKRRGMQQGVVLEEAWELYEKAQSA